MWMGACASTIGTFVQQFAQSWLIYDLTKKPFYLGLDLFLGQLPIMMFSLFGGVFADRMDRRKLLLASQYIQMACAFLLALADVGRSGGFLERDRDERHPVQSCPNHWSDAWRFGLHNVWCNLVLCSERCL